MKKTNKIFLIGNSHLDPIWQWRWQEGSAEAKATLRSALDRMKEFPEFIFVCSSASVYKWVEEFDPDMFEEIKERVKEGRFVVVGGWYVQPDCNLPTGEGFARQTLYSQRYFKEKLGVTAKVGYNVDTFGHNAMIPQILRKSGMDSYVFLRPGPHEKELESYLFKWVSPDGSSVLAHRICGAYGWRFGGYDGLNELIEKNKTEIDSPADAFPFFYGVGNHGGGPTIRNLELLREYAEKNPDCELIYSNLSDFFEYVQNSGIDIPELHDDLQHHASGCYSTVSEIKRNIRRAEFNLSAAEVYSVMSNRLLSRPYKADRFEDAWNNVTFSHFHDILGGCCTRSAYREALPLCYESISYAKKSINNSLQTLSWAIDTSDAPTIPVIVFNPHPFPVRTALRINGSFEKATDFKGNAAAVQKVLSEADANFGRSDTLLLAEIPALGYNTYYMFSERADTTLVSHAMRNWYGTDKPSEKSEECELYANKSCLENKYIKVVFDEKDASVVSYVDKRTGRELLSKGGISAIVIDEDKHDTWSHAKNYFDKVIGKFSDGEITVLENGNLRAGIKLVSRYNDSILTQRFYLEEDSEELTISCELLWLEKHKMLKFAVNTTLTECVADYHIPFGNIVRPMNGEEESGHTWTALEGAEGTLAFFNDCKYSSSASDSTMYLTAIRSPIYGDHGRQRCSENIYTDQGFTEFKYVFRFYENTDRADMTRRAALLNFEPVAILENMHKGTLPKSTSGICGDLSDAVITAVKRSEDGDGVVVRAYDCGGNGTRAKISAPFEEGECDVTFAPYEIKTLLWKDGEKNCCEVLMTELD